MIVILVEKLGPYHIARYNKISEALDVLVIEFGASSETYSWKVESLEKNFQTLSLSNNFPTFFCKLFKILFFDRPKLVLIPGWSNFYSIFSVLAASVAGIKTVLLSDSNHIDFPRKKIKERIKSFLVKRFDFAVVGGRRSKSYLLQLGFAGPIREGSNCVDNNYFFQKSSEYRQKTKYRSSGDNYFLIVSRLVPKKNLLFVLEAYVAYRKLSIGGSRLVIAGDGPLLEELKEFVDRKKVNDYVSFAGFVGYTDLPTLFTNSRCLILGSTSEQWGLVVNEAMACGKPVAVSTMCGCVEDLVHHGKNGFQFSPFDSDALIEIFQNFESDALCAQMGQHSLEVIGDYSLNRFSDVVQKFSQDKT